MILNKLGKILEGKYKGWRIAIQDDTAVSGGYYVNIWSEMDNVGYDDWFEDYEKMKLFVESEYIIEWTDKDYVVRQPTQEEIKKAETLQNLAKKRKF